MAARMETVIRLIKDNQPVSYTGMLTHTWSWLTASTSGSVYRNPLLIESDRADLIDIYCTHGTADRSNSFTRVIERLLKTGWPENVRSINLVAFEGRGQGKSIKLFAEDLLQKIQANGHKRVTLFGHSRGGLVNACFAEYLAGENDIQVEALFNFGTPFQGSTLAVAPLTVFSDSVDEMRPGSPFLTDLQEKILASSSAYYFITGGDDCIVWGERSFIPKYVETHPGSLITLPRHGHLSMMSSRKMISPIRSGLFRSSHDGVDGMVTKFHPLDEIELIEDYRGNCSPG